MIKLKLYIPNNKNLFKNYKQRKNDIEREIGSKLEWNLKESKATTICKSFNFNIHDKTNWSEMLNLLSNQIDKFIEIFKKYKEVNSHMNSKNKIDYTNYWIFLNNPKNWNLEKFLEDTKEKELSLTWTIPPYQKEKFAPNQYGVLRIGRDNRTLKELKGNKRLETGVYAIVKVTSFATEKNEEHAWDKSYNLNKDSSYLRGEYCVNLKIIHNLVDKPLIFKSIMDIPEIRDDKYLINGFQAASIPLSKKCFEKLLELGTQENSLYLETESENKTFNLTGEEREIISKYRIGQSSFKNNLLKEEKRCKICGLKNENFLIASHIKPWSASNEMEKVDKFNGFLLCPNHDKLFDNGYISFEDSGDILISSSLTKDDQMFLNVNSKFKIKLNENSLKYLRYHRDNIFIK